MVRNVNPEPEGSGGFSFDPVEIGILIERWRQIHEGLIQYSSFAATLEGLTGPGDEGASRHMAAKTHTSAVAYIESNETLARFVDNVIQNLTRALAEYQGSDALPPTRLSE